MSHENSFDLTVSYHPVLPHEQRNFLGKQLEAMKELDKCPNLKHYLHLQANMLLEDLTGTVSGSPEFIKEALIKTNSQFAVYKFLLTEVNRIGELEAAYAQLSQDLSN